MCYWLRHRKTHKGEKRADKVRVKRQQGDGPTLPVTRRIRHDTAETDNRGESFNN